MTSQQKGAGDIPHAEAAGKPMSLATALHLAKHFGFRFLQLPKEGKFNRKAKTCPADHEDFKNPGFLAGKGWAGKATRDPAAIRKMHAETGRLFIVCKGAGDEDGFIFIDHDPQAFVGLAGSDHSKEDIATTEQTYLAIREQNKAEAGAGFWWRTARGGCHCAFKAVAGKPAFIPGTKLGGGKRRPPYRNPTSTECYELRSPKGKIGNGVVAYEPDVLPPEGSEVSLLPIGVFEALNKPHAYIPEFGARLLQRFAALCLLTREGERNETFFKLCCNTFREAAAGRVEMNADLLCALRDAAVAAGFEEGNEEAVASTLLSAAANEENPVIEAVDDVCEANSNSFASITFLSLPGDEAAPATEAAFADETPSAASAGLPRQRKGDAEQRLLPALMSRGDLVSRIKDDAEEVDEEGKPVIKKISAKSFKMKEALFGKLLHEEVYPRVRCSSVMHEGVRKKIFYEAVECEDGEVRNFLLEEDEITRRARHALDTARKLKMHLGRDTSYASYLKAVVECWTGECYTGDYEKMKVSKDLVLDRHNNVLDLKNGCRTPFRWDSPVLRQLPSGALDIHSNIKEVKEAARAVFNRGIAPVFKQLDIMVGSGPTAEADKKFIQKQSGYSIRSGNPERVFYIMQSDNSCGKTLYCLAKDNCLGVLAGLGDRSILSHGGKGVDNGINSRIVDAAVRHWIYIEELPGESFTIDDAFFKQFVGGGKIQARQVYGKATAIDILCTAWLLTNAFPYFGDMTAAFGDRIIAHELKGKLTEEDKEGYDEHIKALFSQETMDAFLTWMLEGARLAREDKRVKAAMPPHIQETTDNFLENFGHPFLRFAKDHVVKREDIDNEEDLAGGIAGPSTRALKTNYLEWRRLKKEDPPRSPLVLRDNSFLQLLRSLGFPVRSTKKRIGKPRMHALADNLYLFPVRPEDYDEEREIDPSEFEADGK